MSSSILEVVGLNVDLAGRRVLRDVTLSVGEGELVGLLGPNGAGKTTLMRSILQLLRPQSGSITIDGRSPARARDIVGYMPQRHEFAWDFPISVEQAVMAARVRHIGWGRGPRLEDHRVVRDALEQVDLLSLAARPVGRLSGGQRQRVLVARALARQPRLLLLDEPFTALDHPSQELLTRLFADCAVRGTTIVMSTHDVLAAHDTCSRLVLLNRTVIADGAPRDIGGSEPWRRTFELSDSSPLLRALDLAVTAR